MTLCTVKVNLTVVLQLYVDGMVRLTRCYICVLNYQFVLSGGDEGTIPVCWWGLFVNLKLLFAALCRWYGDAGCYLYIGNEVPVCVILPTSGEEGVTLCTV